MPKKKQPKTMQEITKDFEKMGKEYATDGKNAFQKAVKKAVTDKPN